MIARARLIAALILAGAAVGGLVHVRGLAVAERYELGRLVRVERDLLGEGVRLREQWERAGDPGAVAERAMRELGMRHPQSKQVVR